MKEDTGRALIPFTLGHRAFPFMSAMAILVVVRYVVVFDFAMLRRFSSLRSSNPIVAVNVGPGVKFVGFKYWKL